jgi:hypothetical protein
LNEPPLKLEADAEWHCSHDVEKPAVRWLGDVVRSYCD